MWPLRRWLGLDHEQEDMNAVRAEQQRIAQELESLKRLHIIDLEVEIERLRGMHLPPEPMP